MMVEVIDEDGSLFGAVNIIDALVVLVVIAVVVAGAGLLLTGAGDESGPTELSTTNVTLDIGTQPTYIATAIEAGDPYQPAGDSSLTITDVHLAPVESGANVTVRAELRGPAIGDSLSYANALPRLGRELAISTAEYNATGVIIQRGDNESLDREQTDVVLRDTVSTETAEQIAVGDTDTIGGYETAEVRHVTTYATQNPDRSLVFVGVSLNTLATSERPEYGNTSVREGNELSFRNDSYELSGSIARVGAVEQRGTPTNETVTLQVTDITESRADSFEVGMTERSGGQTVARVTNVTVEPATVTTVADNGTINAVAHPYLREVTLTTELSVRETTSGVSFKGETIQQGSTVGVNLGTITVEAEVVSIGS